MGPKRNLHEICITVNRIVSEMDPKILLFSQNLGGNHLICDGLYNTRRSHVAYTPVSTLEASYGCLMQSCKAHQNIRSLLYIDSLVQDCSNSSALEMELLQSCTKPSI